MSTKSSAPANRVKEAVMKEMIWGYLLHLGYNMWSDREG